MPEFMPERMPERMPESEQTACRERAKAQGGASFPLLSVKQLCLHRQSKVLLDHVSFTLQAAGVSMIMGANGAGKSLLLRALNGLLSPDSGEILWRGVPLSEALQKQHGMVFQKPVLLRRSVVDNVSYVLNKTRQHSDVEQRCITALEEVGLTRQAVQPARLLSGGEQQRLALARALVLQPRVLFLDEPTASLDPASVSVFEKIVMQAHDRGTKIIFVTHDLGQARRLADDVVFLDKGCITEHTEASEFFIQPLSAAARAYTEGRLYLSEAKADSAIIKPDTRQPCPNQDE